MPTNPEPGKCYVRSTTHDVYVNETVTLAIKPAYKVLKIVPATFKTVTERVEVNASLLIANGYCETKTKNRGKEGVSCTEREHAFNRRTEFRLINN